MIQLIINTNLLREIDERKLVLSYARHCYVSEEDATVDDRIKQNLIQILDWDINGEAGLGVYCGKFESIKKRDMEKLVNIIKENASEFPKLLKKYSIDILEENKIMYDAHQKRKERLREKCESPDYSISGRGRKAKPVNYKGKLYKSRMQCELVEKIPRWKLYEYLKETNQL